MGTFLVLSVGNFDQFLTPPPLPIADVVYGRPLTLPFHSYFLFSNHVFSTNYTAYVAGIPKNNIEKEDLSKIAVQDEDISPQRCLLIKLLSMTDQDDVIIDEENYEKKTKGKANNYRTSVNKCLS